MKLLHITIMLGLVILLSTCSNDSEKKNDYLIRVNDYTITSEEINSLLKFETKLNSNFDISTDTRTAFTKNLIQTQLLIQEAEKRHLDQKENFRKTIQRYWESTLIRNLLEEEGQRLRKTTVVSQEELKAYYQQNKNFLGQKSLQELRPKLSQRLEDEKVSERLAKWIEELQSNAIIEIHDPKLAAKVKRKLD